MKPPRGIKKKTKQSSQGSTERKKTVESLKKSQEFAESLIVSMKDGFSILNEKGVHIDVNEALCRMTGFRQEELVGVGPPHPYWPPEEYENIQKAFKKTLRGEFEDFELTFKRKNGERFPVIVSPSWIKDEKDNIISYFATIKDITELKRVEGTIKHLMELDKLKDEFLNIAAHGLKTPLTSIVALSEILKKQKSFLDSEYQKYISIIHKESLRLSYIVQQILTVTRFKSGRETVVVESFNVATLISSLLPSFQVLANKKRSRVITNVEANNIVIKSDIEKIIEVIYNFVDNAIKYGSKGQTITILITNPEKDWVKIGVKDQGPGIPPEAQRKLFTKFSQVESSTPRLQKGIGLGLYICKLIVNMLGGKIGVKSVVGKGSTFYFTLPIKKTPKSSSTK